MPIYEEKLICPLAVRFTQEHIRTTFRDGRDLDPTIQEIKATLCGTEDYDIVLHAPFPNIEIIRWCTPHVDVITDDSKQANSHWFTLDNRRLYCLQRVAARYWPRRVAAIVDILYADPGRIEKKYDSSTFGSSVSIAHSSKSPIIKMWDWNKQVLQHRPAAVGNTFALDANASFAHVLKDDQKETVDCLTDAAVLEKSTPLEALIRQVLANTEEATQRIEFDHSTVMKGLSGKWQDTTGKTYVINFHDEQISTCICSHYGVRRRFTLTYDIENDKIWWGCTGKSFAKASSLVGKPDSINWYAGHARKPKFVWTRLCENSCCKLQTSKVTYGRQEQPFTTWQCELGHDA